MILPIRYLWQQLNGPQTTGICKAIEEYWKTIFDNKLDYFNNLSIYMLFYKSSETFPMFQVV